MSLFEETSVSPKSGEANHKKLSLIDFTGDFDKLTAVFKEHYPMTFVRTKMKLAQIDKGDVLKILLTEGEPLGNVSQSTTEQGFKTLNAEPIEGIVYRIIIEK